MGILRPDRPYRPQLWPLNRTLRDLGGDEGAHGGAAATHWSRLWRKRETAPMEAGWEYN